MKKWLSLILCVAMLLSVCSFAAADETAVPEPFQHISFDGVEDEAYTAVTNIDKDDRIPTLDGANKNIAAADGVTFQYTDGPVGKCLFLDGTFGLDLGLIATESDAWSISYWMNASRLSTYGPTLQIGYNVSRDDSVANVTWMNITQSEWGSNSAKIFPVVWSRNKANDSWPWAYAWDDAIHGKREWVHVTVVTDGTEPAYEETSAPQVNIRYYINGELTYNSAEHLAWANGALAPNIMKPDEEIQFETYFGINYWDTMFKGYVDDLYVFDCALTDEQVKALYAMGDPTVEVDKDGPVPAAAEEAAPVVEVKITGTAVGAEDLSTGWWGAHSDIWAVPAGESVSVTFTDYVPAEGSNWNTFVVVLQNTPTGHSADDAEGYAEYAVVRADNYGWGTGYEGCTPECNWNWNTFITDMNGANVVVTVTNNGETADVVANVKTLSGAEYFQSYKGIAVTGDLYFCLGVDSSCLDIIDAPAK